MSNITENHRISMLFIGTHLDQAARVVFSVIGSFIIFSAVIGNSTLVCIVVKHYMRNLKKHLHDLFIVNLVLVDLLTAGYRSVYLVLSLAVGYQPVVDGSHCSANGMVLAVLFMVNVKSLVTISFNRYMHVCHSHLYRRVFTFPRTVTWCLLIWFFSFLLALPPLWGGAAGCYHYDPRTGMCTLIMKEFTFIKLLTILYSILPPVCIAYFNFAIFRFWRNARLSLSSRYLLVMKELKNRKAQSENWRSKLNETKAVAASVAEGTSLSEMVVKGLHAADNCGDKNCPESLPKDVDETHGTFSETVISISYSYTEETGTGTDDAVLDSEFCRDGSASTNKRSPCDNTVRLADKKLSASSSETSGKDQNKHPVTTKATTSLPSGTPATAREIQHSALSKHQNKSTLIHQQRLRKKNQRREEAFVRSLLVVCVLAFVTFVPYTVLVIVVSYMQQPKEVYIGVALVFYLSNSVNWIVYGAMNPAFKKVYIKIFPWIFNNACCRTNK